MSRVEVTEEEYVDVEDYEEYEWAGQSRIRANSYLPGGLAGAGFLTIQRTDEDEVLDVTGDEAGLGPEQYDENSLVQASRLEAGDKPNQCGSGSRQTDDITVSNGESPEQNILYENPGSGLFYDRDPTKVDEVEHLKTLTKELKDMSTCRVCLDKYVRHVVSTACWHVHCEACWLLTLASKERITIINIQLLFTLNSWSYILIFVETKNV